MYGVINLNNTSEYVFDPNIFDKQRFQQSYQSAFRPQIFNDDKYQIYIAGTLVGRFENDILQNVNQKSIDYFLEKNDVQKLVENLEGLYFIYLIDKIKNEHYLINNKYQLTKLYYYLENNNFHFSDRISTLVPKLTSVEPHFPSIMNFLSNGFNSSDQTQIKGIKKLLPTFWIKIKQNNFEINNYWNKQFEFSRQPFNNLETKLDCYENIYRESLSNYLDVRKPNQLATLLSGGHDTSFVMIQSSKVFHKPVHAFTTVFPDWNFNEQNYAKHVCEKFGGIFHPIAFESKDLDKIVDLISSCEEPVLGSSLPLHILAEFASKVTDTIMGGDGGDTLWGEYYPVGEFHKWTKNLPLIFRNTIHQSSKLLRNLTDWERFWELEHVASLFTTKDCYHRFMNRLCTYRHFSDPTLKQMLVSEVYNSGYQPSILEIVFNKDNFDNALIEGKLFNAFYTYQSYQQTRSMNSFGMEFYLPTINSKLMKFITNLPVEWVNGGTTFHRLTNNKKINRIFHKKALARYLNSDEIYNRSFDIPWYKILIPRPALLENLRKRILRRGWYQAEYINNLFSEFKNQKYKSHEILELKSHGYRILALMSLEVWAMKFLDRNDIDDDNNLRLEDYFQ